MPNVELGDLKHSGHRVRQSVTGHPGASVLYFLCPDDRIGAIVEAWGTSAQYASTHEQARTVAKQKQNELLGMLHAAQSGNFKAANYGVTWSFTDLRDSRVRASAWFLAWDNPRPVMMHATGMDLDQARLLAVDEFLALPEDARRRLFDVAAQW